MNQYYLYIMASYRGTLYIGVTNDLERRVHEHRTGAAPDFSEKYNTSKLVYDEATSDIISAIAREKQLKHWSRRKKVALIESMDPEWIDLAGEW